MRPRSAHPLPGRAAMAQLEVECPAGVGAGDTMAIETPRGRRLEVVVPAGVSAGMVFSVAVAEEGPTLGPVGPSMDMDVGPSWAVAEEPEEEPELEDEEEEPEPSLEEGEPGGEGAGVPAGAGTGDRAGGAAAAASSHLITLCICEGDKEYTVQVLSDASVAEAKEAIEKIHGSPSEQLHLALSSPLTPGGAGGASVAGPFGLDDMLTLSECHVRDGSRLLLSTVMPSPAVAEAGQRGSEAEVEAQRRSREKGAGATLSALSVGEEPPTPEEGAAAPSLTRSTPAPAPAPPPSPPAGTDDGRLSLWRLLSAAGLLEARTSQGVAVDVALAELGVVCAEDVEVLEFEDYATVGITATQRDAITGAKARGADQGAGAGGEAGAGGRVELPEQFAVAEALVAPPPAVSPPRGRSPRSRRRHRSPPSSSRRRAAAARSPPARGFGSVGESPGSHSFGERALHPPPPSPLPPLHPRC
eukprot:SAG25_NODE_664_length_6070_cov_60.968849_7_plen_472_part_00